MWQDACEGVGKYIRDAVHMGVLGMWRCAGCVEVRRCGVSAVRGCVVWIGGAARPTRDPTARLSASPPATTASVRTILLGENQLGEGGLEELLQEEALAGSVSSLIRPKPRKVAHRSGVGKGGHGMHGGKGTMTRSTSEEWQDDDSMGSPLGGEAIEGLVKDCEDELLFSQTDNASRAARGPSPLCLPPTSGLGNVCTDELGDDDFLTVRHVGLEVT